MLYYDLAEMRGEKGAALVYKVEAKSSEYAVRIAQRVKSTGIYKELYSKLPTEYTFLYLKLIIKQTIHPFVRQGVVIRWYKENGKRLSPRESFVPVPDDGLFRELVRSWDIKNVPVKPVNPISFNGARDPLIRSLLLTTIERNVKKGIKNFIEKFYRSRNNVFCGDLYPGGMLACHYAEGIDYSRRNDLNWYRGSAIRPERVLIYFDGLSSKTRKPAEQKVIRQIEKEGFRWTALKRNVIENQGLNYWPAPEAPKDLFIRMTRRRNALEKWILKTGNNLLKEVHYWRAFHKKFNVKVHYIPEEGLAKNITQAIAFDVEKKSGALVGKQRSEIDIGNYDIALHAKHVFFVWNERIKNYLHPDYERIETLIISGYPNNTLDNRRDITQALKSKGAEFIVTLFDCEYGLTCPHSKKAVEDCYRSFLEWAVQDASLGLVLKPKKDRFIDRLDSLEGLLKQAIASGRCLRVPDPQGYFPAQASSGADFVVGCGISSALIESVIAGSRGIHYDISKLKTHEFYKWGHDNLIADDLERLISSLKHYKEDPEGNPKFGDWSSYLDKLDPFRDGKGGERMGIYMRWLLEGFENGKDRRGATEYANERYEEKWGKDKIIKPRSSYEAV